MNWTDRFTAGFYATTVDPITWGDIDRFEIGDGSSISRVSTSIRENAELKLDFVMKSEQLIRIYMDAVQGQDAVHEPLFTGYATSPKYSLNGQLKEQNAPCYGVLKSVSDIKLPLGWYASKGRVATDIIKELLLNLRTNIAEYPPKLSKYIVAENNETNLTMTDKILDAIGWVMQVDGNGVVQLKPKPVEPTLIVSPYNDIVEENVDIEQDIFYVPNVLRVLYNDNVEVAYDNDANSIYSIPRRGREIWEQEEISELSEDTSLTLYAKRRLKELQNAGKQIKYARRFIPELYVQDVIEFRYPNTEGIYRITSQKLELSHNCRTSEEAETL